MTRFSSRSVLRADMRWRLLHVHKIDDEDQRLARRDRATSTTISVGQVRRNDQPATSADPHAGDAVVPAFDDPAAAERKRQRVAAAPRAVELLPRRVSNSDVV